MRWVENVEVAQRSCMDTTRSDQFREGWRNYDGHDDGDLSFSHP